MNSSLPKLISNKVLLNVNKRQFRKSQYFHTTSEKFCENKSIYEKYEEGEKPRTVYGKPVVEWRKPWIKREGEWKSKLALFNEKNPSPEIMNALQKLPDLDFQHVKNWWKEMKVIQEINNQKYLPERVATLGTNLGAVHFFTFRQCAVRLKDSPHWIAGDIQALGKTLPNTYQEGYYIEAIDCSNFHHNGIRYEGLQNLTGLNFLKWLSLKNQKFIDVWCLDRIAGQNGKSIEYLDISSCKLDAGCIYALARMSALKCVVIQDPGEDIATQAAISFLEEEKPELLVKIVEQQVLSEAANEKLVS